MRVEWLALRRTRAVLAVVLGAFTASLLLVFSSLAYAPVIIPAVLLAATIMVSEAAGAGLKHGQGNPQRYSMWGISDRAVRWGQSVVPVLVMTLWSTVVFGGLGILLGYPLAVAHAPVAGIGAGMVATYNSDRAPVAWGREAFFASALGPIPIISISHFIHGYLILALLYIFSFAQCTRCGN